MRHLAFLVLFAALGAAACAGGAAPVATETVCPDPAPDISWDNFGAKFMTDYCTDCHSSTLRHAQRNGAPLYHDYDTFEGMLEIADHTDSYAGSGPAAHNTVMPPIQCPSTPGGPLDRDCPQPTEEEREKLSVWLACQLALLPDKPAQH